MERKITYKIISDSGKELLLATFCDGTYMGKSKGYYKASDRNRIEIYPFRITHPIANVNLRTFRLRSELSWE